MSSLIVKFAKLDKNATVPTKAYEDDLGFDLYALENVTLPVGEVTKIRTGIAAQFPGWCGGLIRDRSSVATKQKVFVVAGVVDTSYVGEIIVAMYNPRHTEYQTPLTFEAGTRIAQMLIMPVIPVDIEEVEQVDVTVTERGSNGFGSTGV